MMGKNKKHIMHSAEDKVLNIDQKDIEQYLSEVKDAVEKSITVRLNIISLAFASSIT